MCTDVHRSVLIAHNFLIPLFFIFLEILSAMPSQRLIASNALMCLNCYCNGSSDSIGSDICYTGEDLDQDIDIVTFENDDGPQNYSTSTESRLSSNDTLDLNPHHQTVVHQRKRSMKRNAKSGI